jgi:hypothetical protein
MSKKKTIKISVKVPVPGKFRKKIMNLVHYNIRRLYRTMTIMYTFIREDNILSVTAVINSQISIYAVKCTILEQF